MKVICSFVATNKRNQMSKLTVPILCAYLPHGVQVQGKYNNQITLRYHHFTNDYGDFIGVDKQAKLLLRPLSSLTKEITHNGETFVPVEWFEIGDDENTSLEYDYGNIKIIKQLEDISRIGMFQFKYLPFGVVQKLIEWHFDLWNLLESGDALPITANQEKS